MNRRVQDGFTIIEMIIACAALLTVLLPAVALFYRFSDFADILESRIEMNSEARHVFDIIGDGGLDVVNGPGNDQTSYVYGLRGHNQPPGVSPWQEKRQFKWSNNGLTTWGSRSPDWTIVCIGKNNPIPECLSKNRQVIIRGWIGENVQITGYERSPENRTTEVDVKITNPLRSRNKNSHFSKATEQYRSIFTLNRDIQNP